ETDLPVEPLVLDIESEHGLPGRRDRELGRVGVRTVEHTTIIDTLPVDRITTAERDPQLVTERLERGVGERGLALRCVAAPQVAQGVVERRGAGEPLLAIRPIVERACDEAG